jgi:hypothetical protein
MENNLKESLEDLATKIKTGLEHSRNVEKIFEGIRCRNQLQPINGQIDESTQQENKI